MVCAALPLGGQTAPAYRNANESTESRIADLLQRMTLQEKVAQLESASSLPDSSALDQRIPM